MNKITHLYSDNMSARWTNASTFVAAEALPIRKASRPALIAMTGLRIAKKSHTRSVWLIEVT
jgi:hypothetical protein